METILTFIQVNQNLIIATATLIVVAVFWYKGQKAMVSKFLLEMVQKAEFKFSAPHQGGRKYKFVKDVYEKNFPEIVKFFFSEEEINEKIEWAVAEMKKKLGKYN